MIIEFSVKNFRSFKDMATLSFEAESLKTEKGCLIKADKIDLLPAVGIFGHNASGKSNLVKALAYMQWAINNSDYLNQPTTKHPLLQPFLLNIESRKEPSFFQIVLWDREKNTEYRYGFEINSESVVSEWLEAISIIKVKRSRRMIFKRKGQSLDLDESIKDSVGHLVNNVRPTALALTVFAQFADPTSSQVIKLLNPSNFMIIDGGSADLIMPHAMKKYHENPDFGIRVFHLIKRLDLSLQSLDIIREQLTEGHLKNVPSQLKSFFSQSTDSFRAITKHKLYGSSKKDELVDFDLIHHESTGTQRLFILAVLLQQILDVGGIAVLDELGASIHPFMSREIVKLFQNPMTNPNGAQAIFCSHETFLISNQVGLRQDQIWFAEKNAQEETVLRCLVEYNIRSDAEFEKNYRQGRFGAVPLI